MRLFPSSPLYEQAPTSEELFQVFFMVYLAGIHWLTMHFRGMAKRETVEQGCRVTQSQVENQIYRD